MPSSRRLRRRTFHRRFRRVARGVFELGPMDISKIDPFYLAAGLLASGRATPSPKVTVHPKIYEMVGSAGFVPGRSRTSRPCVAPLPTRCPGSSRCASTSPETTRA